VKKAKNGDAVDILGGDGQEDQIALPYVKEEVVAAIPQNRRNGVFVVLQQHLVEGLVEVRLEVAIAPLNHGPPLPVQNVNRGDSIGH